LGKIVKAADDIHIRPGSHRAAEDDIASARQGLAKALHDGFKSATPHEHGMPHGGLLEELQITGQMPGKTAVLANDAVLRHRGDGDKLGRSRVGCAHAYGL